MPEKENKIIIEDVNLLRPTNYAIIKTQSGVKIMVLA